MGFDTDALRLFVRAAEILNISAAGRALGMAPAVSSAKLAKLEQNLGSELLHRTTRKVSLSVEGVDFLPFAKEIIAQEEAALAALGKQAATIRGTLRFAAPSSFAQLYIAPILPKFLQQHPDLTLDLRLSDVQFDLIEGSYDLALRNAPLVDTSLKGRKLADDRRILCAAPNYLDKYGTPKTPGDLTNHHLIAFQNRQRRRLTGSAGETAIFDPASAKGQLIIDDGQSQVRATLAGAGISLNALWSVHDHLKSGQLTRVLSYFEAAEDNVLWLIYPKSNVLSPKVRVFMDFLIAEIGAKPPWEA
ncbi:MULTISPECIES: LysR family transcriptional regulator [unclassified Ruegeria]|uniref:LysR family transcriptional regulator n=1 Tax=unclassified Ruegeria TaxID=2625375 RepID=UPI001487E19C|nr:MULTISPECIES: LysR family transcriptional regulator [unclassified Ruegeria]NOD89811.1 LysR family transcriptional regulator [Ruegeria sp. HKCCD4318]NOE14743.1 LysR family transcriptional regulator [Ruegeria sp. HKCCD4318-2]NOG10904.1 LysR family transcriptional regulator [Ruegeria sp. HKCCD4315]